MAIDITKVLNSKRMQNLLYAANGGSVQSSSPDISATPADVELNGNCTDIWAGDGTALTAFNGSVTPVEVDLSASNAGGEIIEDGTTGFILITWDGSSTGAEICVANKKTTRANPSAALVVSNNRNRVPSSLDLSSQVVVAYVKVENASGADFVIGTTSLAAAGITDTYVAVNNILPGSELS